MADDLPDKSVARDDVPLDDLTETLEVIVTDDESAADSGLRRLSLLLDVDVDEILLVELPGQGDTVLAACGWAEHEVTDLTLSQLGDGSP